MSILLSEHNSNYIKVTTNSPRDHSILNTFPGLIKHRLDFLIPKSKHLLLNIIPRLKACRLIGEMSEEVHDFLQEEEEETSLPEEFSFLTEPLYHQKVAFDFCMKMNNVGLLLEPGLGKTKIALDVFAARLCNKALIVCPKALMFVWEEEVKTHRWDKSIYLIKSTSITEEVLEDIDNSDIVVVNYKKAVILQNILSKIRFDFMAVDEALIKSHNSQQTEAVTALGRNIKYKMIMSGTLVNNSVLDIFAPLRFLEPALVGTSFSKFQERYCYMIKEKLSPDAGRKARVFVGSYRNLVEARKILETVSIVMTKKEWLKELPEKDFIPIYVPMTPSQKEMYFDLSSNYISQLKHMRESTSIEGVETAEEDEYIEVDNALALLCKLTQVSNGFVYKEDSSIDELSDSSKLSSSKKRKTFFLEENPKIDRLLLLFQNELKNKKVVLWYNMNAEQTLIENALTNNGISFRTINGKTKNISDIISEFNHNEEIQVLLCQAKAINYGVTILGKTKSKNKDQDEEDSSDFIPDISGLVFTHIFFSLNFSLEVFLQQQDRSHRIGQRHKVTYYILISNNPTDIGIWECLEGKKNIRDQVLIDIVNRVIEDKTHDKKNEQRHR